MSVATISFTYIVTNQILCVFTSGLMADKLGNYVAAFLMAGSVGILGSLIPFLVLCTERKTNSDNHVAYLEEVMDKDQNVPEKCNAYGHDQVSKMTYHIELESLSPLRTTMVRTAPNRPVSFLWAMESPFKF